MYTGLYAGKMLDPIEPVLVHPDAVDTSHWPGGKHVYMDPEGQYILRINNYATPLIQINTQHVEPDAIGSWYDPLEPEYTGKIATFDPTSSGAGLSAATYLGTALGDEFVRHLYVDQKPSSAASTANWPTGWPAAPTRSCWRCATSSSNRSRTTAVQLLRNPPEAPGFVSAGFGLLGLVNYAPHPNAARVLVNWLAARDGMDVWSRAQGIPPVRTDLDTSIYPPEELIDPNASYLDSYGWDYVIKDRDQPMKRLQQVLGG
jgi:iron(III) transport system substrate-binding protein